MRTGREIKARRRARGFGLRAEAAALLLLYCKGYRILARRYLAPGGEIDLVAARGKTIAFVEVKGRPAIGFGRPAIGLARLAITEEKRRRISRAAAHWIGRHGGTISVNFRGDAIFIAPRGW